MKEKQSKETIPRRTLLTWLEREEREKAAFKNWLAGFKKQEAQVSEVSDEEKETIKKAS